MTTAIVFAYHNVGVRCLRVLLDAGVDVRLVVTHTDSPTEAIWFDSVAALAAERGLRCIAPADASAPAVLAAGADAAPDFLFSFYFRQMLGAPWLALPRRGAFNLHGSLLPRYRGRAPVNWAVLHGERETGASLHVMDVKPDHGALVDQCAVPILGDDTARQVFDKVTLAAEIVMARTLPGLLAGSAVFTPQQHLAGQYFGGRRPEDGRIPATASARQIHNLVRAVAPPDYPGAFFDAGPLAGASAVAGTLTGRPGSHRIVIGRTLPAAAAPRADIGAAGCALFALFTRNGALWLQASDGAALRVLHATLDGQPLDAAVFASNFGSGALQPAV